MSWVRDNGVILKKDDKIAVDVNCCCDQNCCCTRISNAFPPPVLRCRIVSGCPFGGTEFDMTVYSVTTGVCRRWKGSVTLSGANCINILTVSIQCVTSPGSPSGCFDYFATVQYSNDQCAVDNTNVDTFPVGQCTCEPKFYAKYCTFSMVNGVGPNCDCCDSYCLEIFEP